MNVWCAMKFMEDEGICTYPEYQTQIYPKLKKVR